MLNNLISQIDTGSYITNPAIPPLLGDNPDSVSYLGKLLPSLVSLILVVGAVIFFFSLVMGAIQWISSGGDKQKLESARGRITSAIIGLVVLLAAFAIIRIIQDFFGIEILTLDIERLFVK